MRIWKPLGLPALSTSVGLKCLRANADLPDPEGPMRTTSESSGTVTIIAMPTSIRDLRRIGLLRRAFSRYYPASLSAPCVVITLKSTSKLRTIF